MNSNLKLRSHLPLLGIVVSVCLFFVATTYYPGGTTDSAATVGYEWAHNFVCSLFAPIALNGAANPARYVAIPAMLVLCVSLGVLFKSISNKSTSRIQRKAIEIGGIGSAVYTVLWSVARRAEGEPGCVPRLATRSELRDVRPGKRRAESKIGSAEPGAPCWPCVRRGRWRPGGVRINSFVSHLYRSRRRERLREVSPYILGSPAYRSTSPLYSAMALGGSRLLGYMEASKN